jgi:hypothetical protein
MNTKFENIYCRSGQKCLRAACPVLFDWRLLFVEVTEDIGNENILSIAPTDLEIQCEEACNPLDI